MALMHISEAISQQPLSRQEDSETKKADPMRVRTMAEARERGLSIKNPQPPDEQCEFCGKTLHHEGFVFSNTVMMWSPYAERCDCEQAKKKWAEHDAEKEREEQEKKRQEQYELQQARINKLLGASGIGKRFQQRIFSTFKTDTPARAKAYQIAKDYADNFAIHMEDGTGLYIEGTNGTGKTHLAAAIAMQLIGEGVPVICKTSSDLLGDIKRSFSAEGAREHEVLDVYKRVDLLIIDDLGKEQCSDWSMSTLYSILNDRYEDMKPTIVTTNYNTEQLTAALTPKGFDNTKIVAIISRLRESCTVMTMAWADARGGGQ